MTITSATILLDTRHHAGPLDRRVFGGFLEHLGRAVYEGVYDPGNPFSDADGFRRDVLDALRPLGMPVIRYPGGNFVSSYDWHDGIGPRTQRPRRRDFAWRSIESNQFGTDEFAQWCGKLKAAPYLAVNLGTGGAREAADLVEYCNLPVGSAWADQRAKNGSAAPYGIKLWCLGNEMDGPWQAGHVPAQVYAQRAEQAGRLMKGLDPGIQLVAAGSSGRFMSTYMEWDRQVLEYCWDTVDFISAHRYSSNEGGQSPCFLAEGVEIERIIQDYRALLSYVRGLKRSEKRIHLCFDEWNVWYRTREFNGQWQAAPHLLEELYNLEDALVCAQYLNAFIRNADVVKVACLAQIVNVIAPLLTKPDGVLLQSIYHAFMLYAQAARGNALTPLVSAPAYDAGPRGQVCSLDVSVTHDAEKLSAAVFLVNRNLQEDLETTIRCVDSRVLSVASGKVLTAADIKLCNTWEQPNLIKPKACKAETRDGAVVIKVPKHSLVVLRMKLKA